MLSINADFVYNSVSSHWLKPMDSLKCPMFSVLERGLLLASYKMHYSRISMTDPSVGGNWSSGTGAQDSWQEAPTWITGASIMDRG